MKSGANAEKENILKTKRACWGKMVRGNHAESGGGGCGDCMLGGRGDGI